VELVAFGLSHRTAPLEIRERLAIPQDALAHTLTELVRAPAVREVMVLSTCNRTEVYAVVDRGVAAERLLASTLSARRGAPMDRIEPHLYHYAGADAVRHLFRVAASLDSMVLGEPQILGQVKEAYAAAQAAKTIGPLLGRCLERAFAVAKRARTDTGVGRSSASVASVAVELARTIFDTLEQREVLVVGAGDMGALAARHLRAAGAATVGVVNRTAARGQALAEALQGQYHPWSSLDERLVRADIVLTTTNSDVPVVTLAQTRRIMKARRWRSLFLIDLAVPRDVEPEVKSIDGVFLFDMDGLQQVADEHRSHRAREAQAAEAMVAQEVERFMGWTRSLGVVPTLRELRERCEAMARTEALRTVASLKEHLRLVRQTPGEGDLEQHLDEAVRQLADAIVNKVLHHPLTALKRESAAGDAEGGAFVQSARRLFGLAELPETGHPNEAGDAPPTAPANGVKDDGDPVPLADPQNTTASESIGELRHATRMR
jgi:glutamyl-tRNA reductase